MKGPWPMVRFDQILARVDRRFEISDLEEYDCVGVRWYGHGSFVRERLFGHEISRKQQWVIKSGDVVYNKLFAWKGAFALADDGVDACIVSDKFPTYLPNPELVDPTYLKFYFRTDTPARQALDLSKGAAAISKLTLNPPQFWDLTIPLPPLEDQRRIVAVIERLAGKIEEARGLRREALEEADALWSRRLTQVRLSALSESKRKQKIGALTTVTSGGTPSRDVAAYWDGAVPWVKSGELLDGDIYRSDEEITEEGLANSGAKLLPAETILVALYGQGQTRGRTGRLMMEAATNQACCAILPVPALEPRFLQYWLKSLYVEMRLSARGGAQPNWNGQMIKSIEIALPPLADQRRIVNCLDDLLAKVDRLKALQAQTAAELDALLPSVLDRAFRGEL